MIIEPPDAWKNQAESTPLAVPNAADPVVEKPANEVIYLLQTISDRLAKLEAEKEHEPTLTTNVNYEVTFTNEELLAQVAQLRRDNHAIAEQCNRKDESIKKFEEALAFRMRKVDELNSKLKILDSFVELVIDRVDERQRDEE